MSFGTALALGFGFWLCRIRLLYGWNQRNALFGSLVVGLIMGRVPEAVAMGASIQLIYIGMISPGSNIPSDPSLAAFVSIPIALMSNMSPEMAVALAVPIGLLGVAIDYVRRTLNSVWIHMADRYAEDAQIGKMMLAGYLYPALMLIPFYVIPVTAACYFGPDAVDAVLAAIPEWVINGLKVTGGVLPALGFAITMMVIGRKNMIPYFLLGFFVTQYGKLPITAAAVFGGIAAYLHMMYTQKAGDAHV